MALLSSADRKRVEATIAEVERHTAGEVVVVVVPRCDDYALWRGAAAVGLSLFGAMVFYEFVWFAPGLWAFVGQIPLLLFFFWLLGLGPLARLVVPKHVRAACVSERAKQLFLDRGLTETRDRSGVLLLLSELEHRVEILADVGIHERVGVEGWRTHVSNVVAAMRDGRAADGVCTAVADVGAELAEAFPPRPDDANELPNEVVTVPKGSSAPD
jgi:putative membrane protein